MRAIHQEADLHVHSHASDGILSPLEVLQVATSKALGAVAITDHDTLAGWRNVRRSHLSDDVLLVPGVEINTEVRGKEVHILGYCFDDAEALETELEELRRARWDRARKMVGLLQELGVAISWEELLEVTGEAAPGRLHVARILVDNDEAATITDAFRDYLLPERPAYVPRHRLTPQEAIGLIGSAGGVAVLAHPGMAVADALVLQLVEAGLKGIEVYHPAHDASDVVHYFRLAEQYDLIATGGSDYHGLGGRNAPSIGSCTVPMATVEALFEAAGT